MRANHSGDQNSTFKETSWTIVLNAAHGSTDKAGRAMASLCESYWPVIYRYIRVHGRDEHDAEDLTQAFFEHLLANDTIRRARREKGRFRSFLLGSLKFFLADETRHRRRLKRGGDHTIVSFDDSESGLNESETVVRADSPDQQFEKEWMRLILQRTQANVRHVYASRGKLPIFDMLVGFVTDDHREITQTDAATRLGLKEGAVKSAIHRLRARFVDELRRQIGGTVLNPEDVDDELRRFHAVFADNKR